MTMSHLAVASIVGGEGSVLNGIFDGVLDEKRIVERHRHIQS